MSQSILSIMQSFDVFQYDLLFMASMAALLGYIIGSIRGGRHAAVAGAISGAILAFTFCAVICLNLRHYLFLIGLYDPRATVTYLIVTSTAGLLGGTAGKAIIDYFFTKKTSFPNHHESFPPIFNKQDTIEKPDVRKATERLQRERYTVIDLDNKPQDSNGYRKE